MPAQSKTELMRRLREERRAAGFKQVYYWVKADEKEKLDKAYDRIVRARK